MFGEPDPINAAIHKLSNLWMQDHHHITEYNVKFNEYSAITGLEGRYLYTKYHEGLASHVKDCLVYNGGPDTLAEFRIQATSLDLHY